MIEIINQTRHRLPRKYLAMLSGELFKHWHLSHHQIMEIIFTGPATMRKINLQYRHQNQPTDVLSFPIAHDPAINQTSSLLGSIFLCPSVIKQQEGKYRYDPYLIHGFMHLMGYDHIKASDYKKWQSVEQQIYRQLKNNFKF